MKLKDIKTSAKPYSIASMMKVSCSTDDPLPKLKVLFRLIGDGWLCPGPVMYRIPEHLQHRGEIADRLQAILSGRNPTKGPVELEGPKPNIQSILPTNRPRGCFERVMEEKEHTESVLGVRSHVMTLWTDLGRAVRVDSRLIAQLKRWWPEAELTYTSNEYAVTLFAYDGDECVSAIMPMVLEHV